MLGSYSLAILLSLSTAEPSGLDALVRDFAAAMAREDLAAVKGSAPPNGPLDQAKDILFLHDEIEIESHRIVSTEVEGESTLVTVELAGTAVLANTREPVPLPRWYSLEVQQKDGRLDLVSAMTLERRLASRAIRSTAAENDALLRAHPEIDIYRYFNNITSIAEPAEDTCRVLLWMLNEAVARRDAGLESSAYQTFSYFAIAVHIAPDGVVSAERALELAHLDGRPDVVSDSYFALGIALWLTGRMDEAVVALREAGSYYDRVADPRLPMRAQYMAGWIEASRNRLRAALSIAQMHQKMVSRLATDHDRMTSAFQIGGVHERLGNLEIARRFFEEARDLAERNNYAEEYAIAAFNIASTYALEGNHEAARPGLEHSAELVKNSLNAFFKATVLTHLGTNQQMHGEFDGAEGTFDEAVTVAHHVPPSVDNNDTIATAYVQRGQFRLAQGRFEQALADARSAREKFGKSRSDALAVEGRALRELGRPIEAEEVLRAAIDFVELELSERQLDEISTAAVLKLKLAPYRELLDLLVAEGCVREALTVAERMRARSLRDSLRNGRVDLSAGMDETRRARELELERAIAEVNRRLLAATDSADIAKLHLERDEARLALRQFRSELYTMHPELGRRRPETSAEYDTWQPSLPPGEVAVELAVGDDATFLFILEGTSIVLRRIDIRRRELEQQVDAFVDALEKRDLSYRKSARSLYDLLLGNVQLANARLLRIVPDGALWRLPFHALIDRGGKHLVDRLPVAYSPSLALGRMRPARRAATRTLLAFGDPAIATDAANPTKALYRDVKLGRLPEAASEARAIARLYSGAQVRLGAEARESSFKNDAAAFRILHLAAHSIFDDSAPMFSSIVLAAAEKNALEDGLLEAREIAELQLNAELAVLSACETARGAVTPGEGMIGLSWAFLAAGVPTTVVSQWKVGSASTADLMIRFHRELRTGDAPAAALRDAMLALRRDAKWRHPFYWAPFVVIENGSGAAERQ